MNIIINNDYAHKFTNMGNTYSAKVELNSDGSMTISKDWAVRDPDEMNLSQGEYATIIEELDKLQYALPKHIMPLPKAEPLPVIGEPIEETTL